MSGLDPWRDVIGCPYCQAPLEPTGDSESPLACVGCAQRFPVVGGIPKLLRHEDAQRLDLLSEEHRQAWLTEGRIHLKPEQARALPYGRPPGFPALYWEVRRQSFCSLMSVLAREGPTRAAGPVADLGAGIGWLSYRLAQLGYQVVAIDSSGDTGFGLGAAREYYSPCAPFIALLGDLEYPPFQPDGLGMVVFNASLHYASDVEGTLRRAGRALCPEGRLFILDTPIAHHPHPGTGRGDRRLGREELEQAMRGAGLQPHWVTIRRGWRWWRHQTRAWLKREPLFSFPMVICEAG